MHESFNMSQNILSYSNYRKFTPTVMNIVKTRSTVVFKFKCSWCILFKARFSGRLYIKTVCTKTYNVSGGCKHFFRRSVIKTYTYLRIIRGK